MKISENIKSSEVLQKQELHKSNPFQQLYTSGRKK